MYVVPFEATETITALVGDPAAPNEVLVANPGQRVTAELLRELGVTADMLQTQTPPADPPKAKATKAAKAATVDAPAAAPADVPVEPVAAAPAVDTPPPAPKPVS